jgi:hypothetical protein
MLALREVVSNLPPSASESVASWIRQYGVLTPTSLAAVPESGPLVAALLASVEAASAPRLPLPRKWDGADCRKGKSGVRCAEGSGFRALEVVHV